MNLAVMQSVYQALKNGLEIPVSRSWPQTPPALPGCTFHLGSWVRQADGSARVSFKVLLRTELQEQGDVYTDQAVPAMLALGYVLEAAEDSFESETGVFVRDLSFMGLEAAPLKPPDASPDFHAAVLGAGEWHSLPEPASFTLKPASRGLIAPQTADFDAQALPYFSLERIRPAVLVITAPYQPDLPALDYLRPAFRIGNEIALRVSYRLPQNPETLLGVLTAFHASALGIYLELAVRNL